MTKYFTVRLAPVLAALALAGCAATGAASPDITRYSEIPTDAYAVVAEIHARPGKEDELRAATLPLVDAVRAESSNILYFLHESRETPGHFIFYEIFPTQADFEAHNATPHVQAWFARLNEFADGDVEVTRMRLRSNTPEAE